MGVTAATHTAWLSRRKLSDNFNPFVALAHAGIHPHTPNKTMSIYHTLQTLNIALPPMAVPAAAYVPFVQTGNWVFLSGHIAKKQGQVWTGQLGKNIGTAEGQQAARAVAIDLLGTLHAAVGDLNKIKRIVKVMSLVNSTPDYTEQHLVTNGCSELLSQVFGPQVGAHARSAFGVAQIPMGACVEIELIAEIG
jgi:enamine deaminase RidA (YjgF/YER057c/UK114 family)